MKRVFFALFATILLPQSILAEDSSNEAKDGNSIEIKFDTVDQLGVRAKPTAHIDNVQEAMDFILADKIVRNSMFKSIEAGYSGWKAKASKVEGEDAWEVRLTSNTQLPPYNCYFRFDSIGNDLRERPWDACRYE